MTKPSSTTSTVLLVRPDPGLKEDPYLALLKTIPELGALPVGAPRGFSLLVDAMRECATRAADLSPTRVIELRALLLEIDEGRGDGLSFRTAVRAFAAATFGGTPEEGEDLTTVHTEAIPLLPGPGADEHAFGWLRWHADRAHLALPSPFDPDIDILMGQLEDEGVEVEEAIEAIADLWERDGKPSLDVRIDGPWSA
jgi:hypothetical protein